MGYYVGGDYALAVAIVFAAILLGCFFCIYRKADLQASRAREQRLRHDLLVARMQALKPGELLYYEKPSEILYCQGEVDMMIKGAEERGKRECGKNRAGDMLDRLLSREESCPWRLEEAIKKVLAEEETKTT